MGAYLECGPATVSEGTLRAWRSKPETQRCVVAASLADGTSRIEAVRSSHETNLMRRACGSLLGAAFSERDGAWHVTGQVPPAARANPVVVDADGSALVARVSLALASTLGIPAQVSGNATLRPRPMDALVNVLEGLGGSFEHPDADRRLPISVTGKVASGGACGVSTQVSSQFLTALLFAAPLMAGGLRIELQGPARSTPYVALTVTALARAGIEVAVGDDLRSFTVAEQAYRPFQARIGCDYTSCSYFMAAAAISGGAVRLQDFDGTSEQGERAIVDILARTGAHLTPSTEGYLVEGNGLRTDMALDATDYPNLIPTLAALGAVGRGTLVVSGGHVTNFHKCPRVPTLVDELRRFGADASVVLDDGVPAGFSITGRERYPGGVTLDAHEDHRVAKALSLLSLRADAPFRITGISSQVAMLEEYVGDCSRLGMPLRIASD